MRRLLIILAVARDRRGLQELFITGRAFILISVCSALLMMGIGTAVIIRQQTVSSPSSTMKGFAAEVSGAFFADMLRMEMPAFETKNTSEDSFSGKNISAFLIRLITDIDPSDPHSLLAGELPMLNGNRATLLRGGSGTDSLQGPEDNAPLPISNTDPTEGVAQGTAHDTTTDKDQIKDSGGEKQGTEAAKTNLAPVDQEDIKPNTGGKDGTATTDGRKVVFIYHSHSRESWVSVAGSSSDPSSQSKNITLVGKRLAEKLEAAGIGAEHSALDYPSITPNYKWANSYKYSRSTVQKAMADDKDLLFFFDIHRDSQVRKYTTATIDGVDYAQVYFIIGHNNPDWRKNEAFATKIHNALEQKYSGLSRGIWGKTSASGNGEYNQSLAADSVLIEVGGIDNTLEESYRTADVLAKVIAELYWDTEKASK